MTNAEIKAIAHRVLQSSLASRGLDRIEVRVESDDVDEPELFVDAYMKPEAGSLGGGVTSGALHALSTALLEAGEMRFPYLRLRYPDQDVADAGASRG